LGWVVLGAGGEPGVVAALSCEQCHSLQTSDVWIVNKFDSIWIGLSRLFGAILGVDFGLGPGQFESKEGCDILHH
jgi:hypothetical protein